jgi:Helicase associated domain
VFQPLAVRFFILTCPLSARSPQAKRDLDAWYNRLRELWQYKAEYGDCRVTQTYENQQLANWVRRQREKKKSTTSPLSLDQVEALNQIGFEWSFRTKVKDKGLQSFGSAPDAETQSLADNTSYKQDIPQSTNESALHGLVRLEPLPREIVAAEAK